ncbi:leukocyte receptor cluster member 1 [Eurytemora carolleeae]|uniref:leukocyte receptor cluster member 1 n=1 Tax=Eurytemora carolleeae TaxID=1294199 RepID=UPI000C759DB0|nr:leukocyte receptor cluster member 1 [Eurytemora carolleeae]|eukprot:XP_023333814.1 leukocyte receptor cluster member 1-like [Eurytemora affinis]
MNILPKKKWHVRTKDNIERVRRDEAKAAEEERERERRQRLAEQEARTSLLRNKARGRLGLDPAELEDKSRPEPGEGRIESQGDKQEPVKQVGFEGGGAIESLTGVGGHVNFFLNLEEGEKLAKGNEEHESEKKKEQEEYEKKIGYLTYLGQDTEELTGEKVWWRKLPVREETEDPAPKSDIGIKQKNFLDPLKDVKKYLGCEHESLSLKKHVVEEKKSLKRKRSSSPEAKKKKKKEKKSKSKSKSKKHKNSDSDKERGRRKKKKRKYSTSSESEEEDRKKKKLNLERLRKERLERERKEREKANRLLHGEPKEEKPSADNPPTLKQSYNSQFNPAIARQNKLDPKQKYWLQ